jgi:hypothetical protein
MVGFSLEAAKVLEKEGERGRKGRKEGREEGRGGKREKFNFAVSRKRGP